MELCSRGHEEICYESGECPMCFSLEELKDANKTIKSLENQIQDLSDEV